MTGTIVLNSMTGEVKITQSKPGSVKWNKLAKDNYKPICIINGWNCSVFPLPKEIKPIIRQNGDGDDD